ncbi:MAG: PACE efflux transporter [Pseudomonadota bacterium]|nr:PACE efflux transporter [Pseudomonadota bacterium]
MTGPNPRPVARDAGRPASCAHPVPSPAPTRALIPNRMSPLRRRLLHALCFEALGLAMAVGFYALVADVGIGAMGLLALGCSLVAMGWNVAFNWGFEAWERRARRRGAPAGRGPMRRAAHAVGFEAGLLILLAPLIAWTLEVTLVEAILMDLGLSAAFVAYTWAFNLGFDRLFGLPQSAR